MGGLCRLWKEYIEGLMGLSDGGRTRGVLIALGCGHFIQRDNPGFVAGEVERLLVSCVPGGRV